MKTIYRFISFFLVLFIGIIVLFNISNSIAIETNFISLRANVGFLIFFCATISSIATMFLGMSLGWSISFEKEKFKRQVEKAKLNLEVESDKVKQLEAKIKTLEEALKMATKK